MPEPIVINPGGVLRDDIASRLMTARKTMSIWVKPTLASADIATLEGKINALPDDYVCRGIDGEHWPQDRLALLGKYLPTEEFDAEGWQRLIPKPNLAIVEAAQLSCRFRVDTERGRMEGKAHDYVVRSQSDPTDIWIVDRSIFEASYEFVK